jgi:hypothetical protein
LIWAGRERQFLESIFTPNNAIENPMRIKVHGFNCEAKQFEGATQKHTIENIVGAASFSL